MYLFLKKFPEIGGACSEYDSVSRQGNVIYSEEDVSESLAQDTGIEPPQWPVLLRVILHPNQQPPTAREVNGLAKTRKWAQSPWQQHASWVTDSLQDTKDIHTRLLVLKENK